MIRMSSSSNAKMLHTERRTVNENGTARPRHSSGQQGGGRNDRVELRRPSSPQLSTAGSTHKRTASGTQRNKTVEERRTERVQVTTKETLTSRTRSPERRSGLPPAQDRVRPKEPASTPSGDNRPRSSRTEAPQGMHLQNLVFKQDLTHRFSTVGSRGFFSSPYDCSISISNFHTAASISSSSGVAT